MANWLDKHEQGGMVLKKKTKDNYGKKENANAGHSTAGPGWVGEGTTNRGFNYNGAWGGTMQMGGNLPHKPTVKEISQIPNRPVRTDSNLENIFEIVDPTGISSWDDVYRSARDYGVFSKETAIDALGAIPMLGKAGKAGKYLGELSKAFAVTGRQKRNAKATAETLKAVGKYGPGAARGTDAKQAYDEFAVGGSLPGAVGHIYARYNQGGYMPGDVDYNAPRKTGSAPSNGKYAKKTKASAQNGQEMKFYQEGLDFVPKSISQNGSVIKDDMGQWAHPGEITEIDSNEITMEGVPYDVIGISDEGDIKDMKPGKNYKFKGSKVTEYPKGGWLNKYK
jgi:hypothetical protein